MRDRRTPITWEDAEAIEAPTLVVTGQQSPEIFQRSVDALLNAMRHARRVTVPNAALVSHWDNPAAFNQEVLAFLNTH